MATKSQVRFCITAQGSPRTLFSAGESKKTGSITISVKPDMFFRNMGEPTGNESILEQKYSIHPSHSSNTHNTIHATTRREGRPKKEWHHLTTAIKSAENFALFSVRRCSNLAKPHFISGSGHTPKIISLGEYNPKITTLYYGLIAGAKSQPFDPVRRMRLGYIPSNRMNIIQYEFTEVRLIIIWSFLALPSPQTSAIYHNKTIESDDESEKRKTLGLTRKECLSLFDFQCKFLHGEQLGIMTAEMGIDPVFEITQPLRKWTENGLDASATREYALAILNLYYQNRDRG